MTTYTWHDVYEYACKAFGQTPRAEDEQVIIEHFERNPAHVIAEIDRLANQLSDGKVTYAWSAWAGRIRQTPSPLRDVVVDGATSRARAIDNARRWIDNAGLHYDLASHVEAELFGDEYARGTLHAWRDDDTLRAEMLDYWRTARPRGEQAEHDHEDWNAKCKRDRTIVDSLRQTMRDTMTAKATHDDARRAALVPRDADDIDFTDAGGAGVAS